MSEYRYYEFRALDRPLSDDEMRDLRAISSRAEITPTSFVNEYNWGDLKASPRQLVEEYFDAYLHISSYGMREVMLRLPKGTLDVEAALAYETQDCLQIWETDDHVILLFSPTLEDFGEEPWWEDQHLLGSIIGIRQQLMQGDFRALYLGWLFAAVYQWLDPEEEEPPVPAGLGGLDGSLSALAQFLLLDDHQLQAAAEESLAPSAPPTDEKLRRWLREQPEARKDEWLFGVIGGSSTQVAASIMSEYARDGGGELTGRPGPGGGRTAGEVHERAEELRGA